MTGGGTVITGGFGDIPGTQVTCPTPGTYEIVGVISDLTDYPGGAVAQWLWQLRRTADNGVVTGPFVGGSCGQSPLTQLADTVAFQTLIGANPGDTFQLEVATTTAPPTRVNDAQEKAPATTGGRGHPKGYIARLVAERQESKKKPRTFTDYRKMLAEKDLDIVLVGTPDHWHALPMIAAVEANADVYCQKPISVDVVEGHAMVAAARTRMAR
jgi:hypothetical protein